MPIRSFGDKETESFWKTGRSRRIPPDVQPRVKRKLWMIDAATQLQDLDAIPGNNLELLSGDLSDRHSIRVNKQWRICFRYVPPDFFDDVSLVDYH